MWIPQEDQVQILTWMFIILTTLCLTIPSAFAAHYHADYKSFSELQEARRTQIIFFWLSCSFIWILIMYYGRAVVTLTKESLRLTVVEDDQWIKKVKEKLRNKKRLKANIKKMEAYNWVCGIVFLFWSIVLIPPMINYELMKQDIVAKIYSFFSTDATPILFGFLIYTIIKENAIDDPTSTDCDEQLDTWIQSLQSGNENTVLLLNNNNLKHDSIYTGNSFCGSNIHEINSFNSRSGTEEYKDINTGHAIIDSNQDNLAGTDEQQDTNTSNNIIDSNQDNLAGTDEQQDTNT
ncbi:28449_t:CDS:2, partial [Racocetra persica]